MSASIAVIGAGLSGLTCARDLQAAGFAVRVFDKGRGVSGRMSLRRIPDSADLQFDHGAQYFTARQPEFQSQVRSWQDGGAVQEWAGPFVTLTAGTTGPDPGSGDPRYVGVPGMNELCKQLAAQLPVTTGVRVTRLHREAEGWSLEAETSQDRQPLPIADRFAAVVCTIPAPQAAELLPAEICFQDTLKSVSLDPCRCMMLSFAEPLGVDFSAAFVQESPLRWISRERTKPGRPGQLDNWVLHASPEWSQQTVNEPNEAVADELTEAFAAALQQPLPKILHRSLHRWLYAIPAEPLNVGSLADAERCLVACGDWAASARVEGAYMSGLSAAQAVRKMLG